MERSMIIRPCDIETTGKEANDEVLEIGCYDIGNVNSVASTLSNGRRTFVRPARPIPPSSSAIHHITASDVADAPVWADAWDTLVEMEIGDDGSELKFAAHMASFERQFLDPLIKAEWLCTWKCSLRQWPDLESHSLQAIRYELSLPADPALAMPPHRALPDAYLCGLLVLELLKHQTVEILIKWSAEPPVFTKFDFGQFKGKPLSVADAGYLDWLANKEHVMGDDWRWNAKREIARRAADIADKAAAGRRAYLDHSLVALPGAASVRDLQNWFIGQADHFAKHGILVGTDEYDAIVAACAARKASLIESGQPQFSATMEKTT
jgi:exodeoxyribonuclease X